MAECIEVNKEVLEELLDDAIAVNTEAWRHGRRVQYKVEYEGQPYMTDYIDIHHDEGRQLYSDKNPLWPAECVMVESWQRKKT